MVRSVIPHDLAV